MLELLYPLDFLLILPEVLYVNNDNLEFEKLPEFDNRTKGKVTEWLSSCEYVTGDMIINSVSVNSKKYFSAWEMFGN